MDFNKNGIEYFDYLLILKNKIRIAKTICVNENKEHRFEIKLLYF